MTIHFVSLLVLLVPAGTAVGLFFVDPERKDLIRRIAKYATGVPVGLAVLMWLGYAPEGAKYQFVTDIDWAPSIGLGFRLGADGISMAMTLLTSIVLYTGVFISSSIKDRVKEHYILLLALGTGVFGVFLSLDLFFF